MDQGPVTSSRTRGRLMSHPPIRGPLARPNSTHIPPSIIEPIIRRGIPRSPERRSPGPGFPGIFALVLYAPRFQVTLIEFQTLDVSDPFIFSRAISALLEVSHCYRLPGLIVLSAGLLLLSFRLSSRDLSARYFRTITGDNEVKYSRAIFLPVTLPT